MLLGTQENKSQEEDRGVKSGQPWGCRTANAFSAQVRQRYKKKNWISGKQFPEQSNSEGADFSQSITSAFPKHPERSLQKTTYLLENVHLLFIHPANAFCVTCLRVRHCAGGRGWMMNKTNVATATMAWSMSWDTNSIGTQTHNYSTWWGYERGHGSV